jgi:tRNA (cmo5U34)-methyltransferase
MGTDPSVPTTAEGDVSDFRKTEWSDASKVEYFMDHASRFIPDRARMQDLVVSLLCDVLLPRFRGHTLAVVELGSGDGALSHALSLSCSDIKLTLLDGSEEMLAGAHRRFASDSRVSYVHATFQDVISSRTALARSHLIVSSLAIHHLTFAEKGQMFAAAARALVPGGAFVNIDVVLSPSDYLEHWYLRLWGEWIRQHDAEADDGQSFHHIPMQYKENQDNLPDTLQDQLGALRSSGLEGVDVFFKSGVFAVYGGFKPA